MVTFKVADIICIIILQILMVIKGYTQDFRSKPGRLMFYNVENLFDIYDDSLTNDDEFQPSGLMRWNYTRYTHKINALYKVIIAAGEWDPPSVVAFCEVENRKVLEDLVYGTYLSKFNYRIIHEDSPDLRGIDVCLIYRSDCAFIEDYRYWIPSSVKKESFLSRSVLYAKIVINMDTLHIIVNHWPSRRGGVLAGEGLRIKIAEMIREKADSIYSRSPSDAKIVIFGDFNCTPDDKEIRSLITPTESGMLLVNLSEEMASDGTGTYRYMGTWEMIDQIIVSDLLLSCEKGIYTDHKMMRIFRPDFLLNKDPKYPGFKPMSTYLGYRYQGGFSDHLPVLLDFMQR